MKAAALLPRVRALVADRPSDAELLQAFATRGDEQAFAMLVRRHGPLVLSAARRGTGNSADADDVFQATFLLLARNATGIRNPAAVGGWLHGVASRMARTARRAAARRRTHETRAVSLPTPDHGDLSWREVQTLFEEELARLPDRYRVPFVLCTLNGEPRADVAGRLGIKEGTISSRLAEARRRLQERLTVRGVSLAVILGTVSLSAPLSAELIDRTLQCTTGRVPAGVSSLLRAEAWPVYKSLIAIGITLSAAVLLTTNSDQRPIAPAKEPVKRELPPKAIEVRGQVLDADGNPLAKVPVHLWSFRNADRLPPAKATTDAAGDFRFDATPDDLNDDAVVVAIPADRPAQWLPLSRFTSEQTIRVPTDDIAFTGRIASLENQPLPGVTVQMIRVSNVADGDLGKWIERNVALRKQNHWVNENGLVPLPAAIVLPTAKATTDAAGKFTLTGFGRDRVLTVRVFGPNVETKHFWVVSRSGGPDGGYIRTDDFSFGLYGPDVAVLLAPSRPLVGTVRDKDGKPVAGAVVSAVNDHVPKAITDKDGHYRLEGVPKKRRYGLNVAGAKGVPIFDHTLMWVDDVAGLDPLKTDLTVEIGLELTGRVVDADGKSVRAEAMYFPRGEKDLNLQRVISSDGWRTKPDGSFFLTVYPGKGVLSVQARETNQFAVVDPGPALTAIKNRSRPGGAVHAIIPLDIDPVKPETLTIRIQLEPSRTLKGMVVGPDGKPQSGARAAGLSFSESSKVLPSAEFTMAAPRPGARRLVIVIHEDKKLAAVHSVSGDSNGPVTVRLAPLGSATGRVMKSETEPGAGWTITVVASVPAGDDYDNLPNHTMKVQGLFGISRGPWRNWTNRSVKSDQDGRFTLDNLLPGLKYTLYVSDGDLGESGTLVTRRNDVSVEAGKTTELGTLSRSEKNE
jgi:RNA polymerase sigma factor (sigma-70 family)